MRIAAAETFRSVNALEDLECFQNIIRGELFLHNLLVLCPERSLSCFLQRFLDFFPPPLLVTEWIGRI